MNKDVTKKPIIDTKKPKPDTIDPFLLRIDKLDKLDLEEASPSGKKQGKEEFPDEQMEEEEPVIKKEVKKDAPA
jgi:hypothetical protein